MSKYIETTDEPTQTSFPVNRRTALRGMALAAGAFAFGGTLPSFSGVASATSTTIETLYLTDSGGDNGGSFLTKLYRVNLDATTNRANLTLIVELTDSDFDQVDAIAASLDGMIVYMVDKNSKHLGTYDVTGGQFTDEGAIGGLPGGTVLASFSPSGTLFVASQSDNKLYTVDPSGPTAIEFVTVTGATVQGADIAFDAAGTLFLYSSGEQKLYTIDYDSSSPTFGEATLVGETGDFFTGLAVRDAGNGDLVGSNTTRDQIVVVNKTTGAQDVAFDMYLNGSRYAYGYGDMTVGELDVDTCEECTSEELLAKYEFACVEEVDGECVSYDFVLEKGDGSLVSYVEFESADGEVDEPMTATFDTEYCSLYALVKSGQEFEVQFYDDLDGSVTVGTANGEKYAISFVAFYCTEEAANEALDTFPSKGKGR